MSNHQLSADYSAITTIGLLNSPYSNTSTLFDSNFVDNKLSPIDAFIQNCESINKIWVSLQEVSPELGRILLLGYVSAVESFLRTLFSAILNNDERAKVNAHSYVISYGAALFHKKEILADALLEGYSFSGEKDIKKAFEKFLESNNPSESVKLLLIEYEKICQMRHCCVHRFGKLGSLNGIALGLESHKDLLEKPLILDKTSISNIASWLMSFSKLINNYAFQVLLDRTLSSKNEYKVNWTWSFTKDKKHFFKLYQIFRTTLDSNPSIPVKDLYNRFKLAKKPSQKTVSNNKKAKKTNP